MFLSLNCHDDLLTVLCFEMRDWRPHDIESNHLFDFDPVMLFCPSFEELRAISEMNIRLANIGDDSSRIQLQLKCDRVSKILRLIVEQHRLRRLIAHA